jgi:hypothetical protein
MKLYLEHLQRCSVHDPVKIYFTSKFKVMYSCATPPIKVKVGQQIGGGGLLIANHLDESLRWAWSQTLSSSAQLDHIYYTLFWRYTALLRPYQASALRALYTDPKPFSWAKPAYFGFSSSNSTLQDDHILITTGDPFRAQISLYFGVESHSLGCLRY